MPTNDAWLADPTGTLAVPDLPPGKYVIVASADGYFESRHALTKAEADLESGLSHFIIRRDGKFLAKVPEDGKNRFGRPIFQNLQYSDTPTQPLVPMRFTDDTAEAGTSHRYEVIAVNTLGLKSKSLGSP